jgi:hypothetical protein
MVRLCALTSWLKVVVVVNFASASLLTEQLLPGVHSSNFGLCIPTICHHHAGYGWLQWLNSAHVCLQVYLTLCFALASSAVGAYLHIALNIGGLLTLIACIGCIAWLFSVPVYEEVCLAFF